MSEESEKIQKVTKFIFNDEVQGILSDINNNVMEMNILEITGMGNQEIKHSNMLGWLFGDNEHKLRYMLLNNFLKEVIRFNAKEAQSITQRLEEYTYLTPKNDLIIYRERDNIDLLIVDEPNKIVLVIENKVSAYERTDGEDGGQLKKYEEIVKQKYGSNYEIFYLFLTINSERPQMGNETWLRASHNMIKTSIENALKKSNMDERTKIVLESYIDLLKRRGIVADEKLKELCEKIWANEEYVEAIDILLNHRTTPLQIFYQKLRNKLSIPEESDFYQSENINSLYKSVDMQWEEKYFFDIQLSYFGGKDEHIWFGFYYPELIGTKMSKPCFDVMKNEIKRKPGKKQESTIRVFYADDLAKGEDFLIEEIEGILKRIDSAIGEKCLSLKT